MNVWNLRGSARGSLCAPNYEILRFRLLLFWRPNRSPNCFVPQGNYADAKPLYERSLAIDEQVYGRSHPEVATVLDNIAELLMEQVMVDFYV